MRSLPAIFLMGFLLASCARDAGPTGRIPGPGAEPVPRGPMAPTPDADAPDAETASDAGPDGALVPPDGSPPDAGDGSLPDAGDGSLPEAAAPPDADPAPDLPPLMIVRRYDGERFCLTPASKEGGFDEDDLAIARQAWARRKTGSTHEIHPRLLDLLYRTARHFKAPHIVLTSGYRPERITSYHAHGRALDFRVPGVNCRTLAKHLRTFGFVGVGLYPRTGGVHLDIRPSSYFWISYAPRGVRWRERGILHGLARQMDREALERGEQRPEPLPAAARAARKRRSYRRHRGRKRRGRSRKRRDVRKRNASPRQAR